jgi:hypothetical protein
MAIKHTFVNPVPDDPFFAGTKPSDWNADHTLGADDNLVTDAQIAIINATSGTNTGDNSANTLYSGLVTNATHTGDVTGDTALTIGALKVTNAMLAGSIDLTAKVTGILPSANGGTGINNSFNLTIPATGTAALLGIANVFTATQSITGTLGINQITPTAKIDITTLAIGSTQGDSNGLALVNSTPAALGASNQQYSPPIRWSGQAWKSGTSTSHDMSFRAYIVPHQNSTTPYGVLVIDAAKEGGAYTTLLAISSLTTGSIGMGTDDPNPGQRLNVVGRISAISETSKDIFFDCTRGSNANLAMFRINPAGSLTSTNQQWWIGMGANSSTFWFAPYYQNPLTPTVVFTLTGNVGIGVGSLTPAARLHIVGGADDEQLLITGNATQTSNVFETRTSADVTQISFDNSGGAVFNVSGSTDGDFIVRSDIYDALFVDASADSIDIMHHASGLIGFFAQTPAAQQNYTAVSDPPTQAQVTTIRDALINLGLMKAS